MWGKCEDLTESDFFITSYVVYRGIYIEGQYLVPVYLVYTRVTDTCIIREDTSTYGFSVIFGIITNLKSERLRINSWIWGNLRCPLPPIITKACLCIWWFDTQRVFGIIIDASPFWTAVSPVLGTNYLEFELFVSKTGLTPVLKGVVVFLVEMIYMLNNNVGYGSLYVRHIRLDLSYDTAALLFWRVLHLLSVPWSFFEQRYMLSDSKQA